MTPPSGAAAVHGRGSEPHFAQTAQPAAIVLDNVSRRYRRNAAVDGASVTIRAGAITGLIGRNGAGKTTLLRLIAGQERASAGAVLVGGAAPFDSPIVARRIVLTREDQLYPDVTVRDVLAVASAARPGWDQALADQLIEAFELPIMRKIKKLSRGMRSALGIVAGLAARAEITLMDEPIAGLDPVARQIFYDALLASYAEAPRTFVISTHLIDEIAPLVEDVVIMRRGRIVLSGPVADVSDSIVAVSGPKVAVDFIAERSGAAVEALAGRARAVIHGRITDAERAAALSAGVRLESLTLQQVLVEQDDMPGAAACRDPEFGSVAKATPKGARR